ncbi:type I polyketide synthase [Actinomadura opuntiae]|uniref:type I polyketide synthase n=1 Tax=Actinomadura sp. OS1-43 TaxID=604315 RepID=UPI00255AE82F|nr:type I polyketide synthase [Actinomadura sp. OS1-43]MDL4820297.1 type I polyketide synthase [Actinomadura sp. OS1-43]
MSRIAVIGMACRYPDATSPTELWENALAGRRAFRRLPDVRMRLADYWDADPAAPDRFYARNAAVLEGYAFDRVRHKIAGSTFRSTDLTHWLALDIAERALADAGFPGAEGLPAERTGVVVGNTLTGEFSRANLMRVRWPYVRRTVAAALREEGWEDEPLAQFLATLERRYKAPFPAVNEDTLAGGLSNTIAGRICNYFDLKGGGYTVDGACSSSLLSVATACRALLDGELDAAVAGGVDLSLDPFEIVGFAKTGALARGEMRVYDRGSNGFWPGEGCGMVVLVREEDARRYGREPYAVVAGWGVSSDGKGGITRPEKRGYRLALRRAYERAGFGIETVPFFEGHGTGTEIGDATELAALTEARAEARAEAVDGTVPRAAIGSIKGMIGHTKAAAGIAGFIKAVMAVRERMVPPTAGCVDPHPVLTGEDAALRVLRRAEPWPDGAPARAGVTAMGFGGINTHLVVEGTGPRRAAPAAASVALARSVQDAELLLFDADTPAELRDRIAGLAGWVSGLSYAQLSDLGAVLQSRLTGGTARAAVIASSPQDAADRLRSLAAALEEGETSRLTPSGTAFLGRVTRPAAIGFLFPGQGSGRGTSGGALRRRFAEAEDVYLRAALPSAGDTTATAVAQPRIATGSMAGLRALESLGVHAVVAVGHSLGEISALHWAGALDAEALLRVTATRGRTMAEHSASGTMAGLSAPPERVAELITDLPVVIAGYNGPGQTVVAGPNDAVDEAGRRAAGAGVPWTRIAVSHAFHSPLVAPAAGAFADALAGERFGGVERRLVSTVTGEPLPVRTDVPELLRRQITEPVLFSQALQLAAKEADLFVEVGPGRVLTGLVAGITGTPAVALDTDDESLTSLLRVVAAAFVSGAPVDTAALFRDRLTRPLEIGAEFDFLTSPCEQAPELALEEYVAPAPAEPDATAGGEGAAAGESSLELLRRLAAERAELPAELVRDDSRPLDDLHLSSITVGQLMNQAALLLDLPPAQTVVNYATASLGELAAALDTLAETAGGAPAAPAAEGAAAWARAFTVDLDPAPPAPPAEPEEDGPWTLYAPAGHPFAGALRQALQRARVGAGVLVCLPPDCDEDALRLALDGAHAALADGSVTRFVLTGDGRGAAGLAKTLRLEAPRLRVTVVHLPAVPDAVDRVVAEVAATAGFSEVMHDADGRRLVPTLRPMPVTPEREEPPLGPDDVLLVTGGGKGITAECALAVAAGTGAALAVLGRSDPAGDDELAANLRRMADAGARVHYVRADVTDPAQVQAAVAEIGAALGPVTGVLHGAGRNEPAALPNLDADAFRAAIAPKIDGLEAVLGAVDPGALRLLVAFGSIIGRSGLPGEAHYAVANDWMAHLTRAFAERHPACRCLCVEWSVWSGVGMGERLAVVESLARDGITPIGPDQGVALMRRLVADPDAPPVVVVSGRTGRVDTVRRDRPELPLLRFVDRVLVHYPGVELVTEVELGAGTDRYLPDHHLDGNALFPAVFGMEAMAQAARAVAGHAGTPVFEDVEFLRPVVVPPDGSTAVRIAAVVTGDDTVEVAIRSAETGFAADHFRARLRYGAGGPEGGPPEQVPDALPAVPLDPGADLYGGVLFQGERFHRLRGYRRAAARHVDADVAAVPADWFAGYLPDALVLGDPGLRDALMHGNQVCVPDATLLPVGIERLYPGGDKLTGTLRYCATERAQDGDTYTYDIAVRDGDGTVVERWEGLRLRAVRRSDGTGPWVGPLLSGHLERTLADVAGISVAVGVEPEPHTEAGTGVEARRARSALAVSRALGRPAVLRYRPDGRPELDGASGDATAVSVSHGPGLTFAVAGPGPLGCDAELAAPRPDAEWDGLLGPHRPLLDLVTAEQDANSGTAGTRIWAARECLQKAGLPAGAPLTLLPPARPGWVVLASGDLRVATFATTLRDVPEPVVFAVLSRPVATGRA